MNDPLTAYGAPYDSAGVRVLFCGQGAAWCGWLRTSNSEKQHMRYQAEREGHETHCKGGGQ